MLRSSTSHICNTPRNRAQPSHAKRFINTQKSNYFLSTYTSPLLHQPSQKQQSPYKILSQDSISVQSQYYSKKRRPGEEMNIQDEIKEPFEDIRNVDWDEPEGSDEYPMPYFRNYPSFESSITRDPKLDEDTGEELRDEDNEAYAFAERVVKGQEDPRRFLDKVNPNHLWSSIRALPQDALDPLIDDVMYHVHPDWLFMDEADFALPEGDDSIFGSKEEAKHPVEYRVTEFLWHMSERESDPLNKETDEFVKEWRANYVPQAVQNRMWDLHRTDQHFWNYDRLARTFAVKRHIVKAVCILKEQEEAIDNGLPFDENKNLKVFKWERKAEKAMQQRPWKAKQISQEEAYHEYIKAISKPETLGDADALPLFKGALKKNAKQAGEEVKQLRDISSDSGLGVIAPRSQFVFVEVGRNVDDNKRRWIVRDMDGTLRTATNEEREFVIDQYPSKRLGRKKYH